MVFQCRRAKWELAGSLGFSPQALTVSPHLLLQLLDLEHQGLCFPGPLLPFQQGLVYLQLLLQQLLGLGQRRAVPGTLGEGTERALRLAGSQEFCL